MNDLLLKHPAACAAIPFISGIIVAKYYELHLSSVFFLFAVSLLTSAIFLASSHYHASTIILLIAFFLFGFISSSMHEEICHVNHVRKLSQENAEIFDNRGMEITGIITKNIEVSSRGLYVVVSLSNISSPHCTGSVEGKIRLFIPYDSTAHERIILLPGDRIEAFTKVRIPRRFGNASAFDYPLYLACQGIDLTGSVKNPQLLSIERRKHWSLTRVLSHARQKIIHNVQSLNGCWHKQQETIGIVLAITIGNKEWIDSKTSKILRMGGVYHVVAISGLHCGIIAWIAFKILCLFRLPMKVNCYVTSSLLIVFLLLSGGRSSVTRAVTMSIVYLIAKSIQRKPHIMNCIACAAYGMLIWNPLLIYDVGFQLTFVAAASLIILYPAMRGITRKIGFLSPILAATVSVQIGTMPIIAYHFNCISFFGIVSNAIAVPLLFLMVPLGYFAEALTFISQTAANISFLILHIMVKAIISSASLHTHFPCLSYRVPTPPLMIVILYYCAGFLFLTLRSSMRIRVLLFVLWSLLCTLIILHPFRPTTYAPFEVTFLDVGQGDASMIALHDGYAILIDGGPGGTESFDAGEMVVSEYLFSRSFKKIDTIIASHLHSDHAGGIPSIIENFAVTQVVISEKEREEPLFKEILRVCEITGTKLTTVHERLRIKNDAIDIAIVDPCVAWDEKASQNERSLIVRVQYGKIRCLFMGDAPASVERSLVDSGENIECEILKVGHHGSKDATTELFLEKAAPEICVISVGAWNSWGHPAQCVVDRITGTGALLFRTDLDGAACVYSDGVQFSVHSHRSNRHECCCEMQDAQSP